MAFVNLLQSMYPVGSIYLSSIETSPSTIVGGTWTPITGRVLRGNASFTTGGEDSEILDLNHNHAMTLEMPPAGSGDWAYNTNKSGFGLHVGDAALPTKPVLISTSKNDYGTVNGPSQLDGGNTSIPLGDKIISHLPAYQNVYCWRRIA